MNKNVRSIKEFKYRNQPQELTVTTASATLGNAARAVMYEGKIVLDLTAVSKLTIGGIPFPIRIIDGSFLARTAGTSGKPIYVYSGSGVTATAFKFAHVGSAFNASSKVSTTGLNRIIPVSLTNCIISGSQITIGAGDKDGAGIVTLYYEPY